jgi:hypothetical protein
MRLSKLLTEGTEKTIKRVALFKVDLSKNESKAYLIELTIDGNKNFEMKCYWGRDDDAQLHISIFKDDKKEDKEKTQLFDWLRSIFTKGRSQNKLVTKDMIEALDSVKEQIKEKKKYGKPVFDKMTL